MQLLEGKLVFSASDLSDYLSCEHLTHLELAAIKDGSERPESSSADNEVLKRRGDEHEQRYLETLKSDGLKVIEINRKPDLPGLLAAARATIEAMRSGADIIYQATFFDGTWLGHADFLKRIPTPSELGSFSYEVEDTKLSRKAKATALLQVCAYSEMLSCLQGLAPERVHLVLGDMTRRSFCLKDYAAYFRKVKKDFLATVLGRSSETYPHPVDHCRVCTWMAVCEERIRNDDHLYLVAGITRDQVKKLTSVGITTLTELSRIKSGFKVRGIGDHTLARLIHQARLQFEQRHAGEIKYELLPPEGPGRGLCTLPEPTPADLFFDMEGDPFAEEGGLEYLFGVVSIDEGKQNYHSFWAHNRTEEKKAFEEFIDFVMGRFGQNPKLHIFHYAGYEPTAVKRLMGVHSTREEEVDRLLRRGVFVDLYRVVNQGIRVSTESYSIKDIEPLYNMNREGSVTDAASSIAAYEEWLETEDPKVLEDIAEYNCDDCASMWKMQSWLEGLRKEAEIKFNLEMPRPELRNPEPSEATAETQNETQELVEALTLDTPDDPAERTDEQQAKWLLAQLLGWHRREAKSGWWAFFNRLEMNDDELLEDPEAIAFLQYEGISETIRQSFVHRYRFNPEQDHKIKEGDIPYDPATVKSVGTVHYIDSLAGILDLKRSAKSQIPHPNSIIPGPPINTTVLQRSLARVARWVIDNGIGGDGPYRAIRDLLRRLPPRIKGLSPGELLEKRGESTLDAARRLVLMMEESCLPIQGPPGAGKTYTGARMIFDLVRDGKRVGITATSHKAISNLLREVCKYAAEKGVRIRAIQKAPDGEHVEDDMVSQASSNDEIELALAGKSVNIVAGTAWLFSRSGLGRGVDTLFIDEAAQMSLANVVAIGGAAQNLVLLGDPCQLAQPSQGYHPPGAECSALEHLLGEHATIPPEKGLFLERTWRLHPEICEFVSEIFYEGRLEADPSCRNQALGEGPGLKGSGLRFLPINHWGNRTSSTEEAKRVAKELRNLIEREWTDRYANKRPIALDDILVVAPYNAQVARISAFLGRNARVGTVDKFQGQEAPIVFYSMATSNKEEIPRGLDFLFSLNRLNVAISRARGLAILVCSPNLLRVRCQTTHEMRLVNALCRMVEIVRGIYKQGLDIKKV